MFKQMYDFLGLGVYSMPQYLASTNHRNPTDYHNGAFQYGHRTTLGPFEYVKKDPERLKVYNSAMQSLTTIGAAGKAAGAFPFEEELGQEGIVETDVLVVDVGGGRGQALRAIREKFPGLKGRMILQDLPEVIGDAEASGLPSFIEPMVASFFKSQPVEGKRVEPFISLMLGTLSTQGFCSVSLRRSMREPCQRRALTVYCRSPDLPLPPHLSRLVRRGVAPYPSQHDPSNESPIPHPDHRHGGTGRRCTTPCGDAGYQHDELRRHGADAAAVGESTPDSRPEHQEVLVTGGRLTAYH